MCKFFQIVSGLRADFFKHLTLFADYNCLTTAEGLLSAGMEDTLVTFDMFFRELPDKGGYAVMAGLEQLVERLKKLKFDEECIESFKGQGFSEKFLE